MGFWSTLGKIGLGAVTAGGSLAIPGLGLGGGGNSAMPGATGGLTDNKWLNLALMLGIPASVLLAGGLSGNMSSGTISPITAPPMYPDLQSSFGDWLKTFVGKGVDAYPGELYPDVSKTRLPEVWQSWQPWDAGTQFLANFLTQPRQDQALMDLFLQTQSQGGPTGRPTSLMNNMTQWGGTGGPGNQALSYLMQFGAPSQAGQYAANMAQFGVPSMGAGGALAKRAGKGAEEWLGPFLSGRPSYTAPNPGR